MLSGLTWRDGDRTLITCPLCRQGARVDLYGERLAVECFATCDEADVLAALNVDRVKTELRGANVAGDDKPRGRRSLRFTPASAIRPERTRWLWDGRVPLGTLSLLPGKQGLGKSTLTLELAARLSRGELAGDLAGEAAATLIVPTRTTLPRRLSRACPPPPPSSIACGS